MAKTQRFTASEMVKIVEQSDGTIASIARIAGLSEQAVRNYAKRFKSVEKTIQGTLAKRQDERLRQLEQERAEQESLRKKMFSAAEGALADIILAGPLNKHYWAAVKFALSTLGRDIYSTRSEVANTEVIELTPELQELLGQLGIAPDAILRELETIARDALEK